MMTHEREMDHHAQGKMMYLRFAGMIITSAVLMYFFTYLNTYAWDHVTFSETRVYMTLTMAAMMATVMLSFMRKMLPDRRANLSIYAGSIVLFVLALWLVRSQTTVQDVSYMRAMIPHHSIAILTSERARISDPRVRELANEIIAAQRREISMMKLLINDLAFGGEEVASEDTETTTMLLGPKVPSPSASAVALPPGFRAEVVMSELTCPTSVEFDDTGTMYVAEAGYSYGCDTATPRILRATRDGRVSVLARGEPLVGPINDLLWHDGRLYVAHRGKISLLEPDGRVRDLVTGLPSEGDHHTNQLTAGPDGRIYFGQGTATNSGVVGLDNLKRGWLKKHPDVHDVPAMNVRLAGRPFEAANPFRTTARETRTLPFHAFGDGNPDDLTVVGQVKAGGTVLCMNPGGSGLEVYAWGLRNPFGVMWGPDGRLYASENGCDVRGSRPIANDQDDIYIIRQGAWYGWPDYAMGLPVTSPRFKPEGKPQPQFLMAQHPPVERPWLNFPRHSAITKLEFSRSDAFGEGMMFAAFSGQMSPMTGKPPDDQGGHQVVRIDPASRRVETFFGKKEMGEHPGGAGHGGGEEKGRKAGGGADLEVKDESFTAGPRRLLDVRFSPDGQALYIADFGALTVKGGAVPVPKTGVIWRVMPVSVRRAALPTQLSAPG